MAEWRAEELEGENFTLYIRSNKARTKRCEWTFFFCVHKFTKHNSTIVKFSNPNPILHLQSSEILIQRAERNLVRTSPGHGGWSGMKKGLKFSSSTLSSCRVELDTTLSSSIPSHSISLFLIHINFLLKTSSNFNSLFSTTSYCADYGCELSRERSKWFSENEEIIHFPRHFTKCYVTLNSLRLLLSSELCASIRQKRLIFIFNLFSLAETRCIMCIESGNCVAHKSPSVSFCSLPCSNL